MKITYFATSKNQRLSTHMVTVENLDILTVVDQDQPVVQESISFAGNASQIQMLQTV